MEHNVYPLAINRYIFLPINVRFPLYRKRTYQGGQGFQMGAYSQLPGVNQADGDISQWVCPTEDTGITQVAVAYCESVPNIPKGVPPSIPSARCCRLISGGYCEYDQLTANGLI